MPLTVMALLVIFAFYAQRLVEARRRAEQDVKQVNAELSQIFDTAADGMRVEDDGAGFDTASTGHDKSFGLLGMRERVNDFDGEFRVETSPGAGNVVTVHTDVPYSQVIAHSVYLNGIAISSWKADARGYFVAKFRMDEVKTLTGLSIGGYNELTLTGVLVDYSQFLGLDDIMVVDNLPKGGR